MYTRLHPLIDIRSGETADLSFAVTDAAGASLDLGGASAEYRIARRAGEPALTSLSSDAESITIGGGYVTAHVDTGVLIQNGKPVLGDCFGQLRLTLGGRTLVVAEGPLCIHPVILPAAEE